MGVPIKDFTMLYSYNNDEYISVACTQNSKNTTQAHNVMHTHPTHKHTCMHAHNNYATHMYIHSIYIYIYIYTGA